MSRLISELCPDTGFRGHNSDHMFEIEGRTYSAVQIATLNGTELLFKSVESGNTENLLKVINGEIERIETGYSELYERVKGLLEKYESKNSIRI